MIMSGAPLTPSKRPNDQSLAAEPYGKGKMQKTAGRKPSYQPLKSLRVLCPASKTGGLIGDGGAVISQICKQSGANVRVEEGIPGCDENIVVISFPDEEGEANTKEESKQGGGEDGNGDPENEDKKDDKEGGEHKESKPEEESKSVNETSLLQKALLLVFDRLVEAEAKMDAEDEGKEKTSMIAMRLLVLSTQVGCVLGKRGSVVKQMSAESGAQIRILPRDKLPSCASSIDELVQITGAVNAVRKAIQLVSQQLLNYLSRDHDSFPANSTGPSSHSISHSLPRQEAYPPPFHPFAAQGAPYAAGRQDVYESGIPGQVKPVPEIITFRLLCHAERVGAVIGKGGMIVKTLQQETGSEIKVMEGVLDSEDRIIVISGPAHPEDRISPVQDAVLRVQSRIVRTVSDSLKKTVIARLLVNSNQIGCLLGKGGSIMVEMRKSSGAYIQILGKDQNPKCGTESEDVVQINGVNEAVLEALLQITTRLRHRHFLDAFPSVDHPSHSAFLDQLPPPFPPYMGRREVSPPFHSFHNYDGMVGPPSRVGFHPHDDHPTFMHNIPRPGLPLHISEQKPWGPQGLVENADPMGFPDFAGPQRRNSGLGVSHQPIIRSTSIEVIVPSSLVPIIYGEDGACLEQICEISDAKITITDPKPGAAETVIVISGTPEETHAAQSLIQAFVISEKESAWPFQLGIQDKVDFGGWGGD